MKPIGARLDRRVDDGAIAAAEFCAVGVGLDLELLQRLHRGLNDIVGLVQQIGKFGIVVHSIQQEIILQGPRPVGGEAVTALVASAWLAGRRPGGEQCQLREVAAVER